MPNPQPQWPPTEDSPQGKGLQMLCHGGLTPSALSEAAEVRLDIHPTCTELTLMGPRELSKAFPCRPCSPVGRYQCLCATSSKGSFWDTCTPHPNIAVCWMWSGSQLPACASFKHRWQVQGARTQGKCLPPTPPLFFGGGPLPEVLRSYS